MHFSPKTNSETDQTAKAENPRQLQQLFKLLPIKKSLSLIRMTWNLQYHELDQKQKMPQYSISFEDDVKISDYCAVQKHLNNQ